MNNTHGALTHMCVCMGKGKEEKRGESEIFMRNSPPLTGYRSTSPTPLIQTPVKSDFTAHVQCFTLYNILREMQAN